MNIKQIFVALSTVVMLVVNAMAVLLPINNKTTAELSDALEIYFVPEGYVFSIWSLIYLAVIGYSVYQLLPKNKGNTQLHSVAWLYVVNALANAGWMLLWHYEYVAASVLLMLVILTTLIAIYLKLEIGRKKVSLSEYWFSHFPFSLYLGWISVATIANIAGALFKHEWGAWGIEPQVWSAIMIAVAAVLTFVMLMRHKDIVFAGVIVWAVTGIAMKFQDVQIIVSTSAVAIIAIVITAVVALLMGQQTKPAQTDAKKG